MTVLRVAGWVLEGKGRLFSNPVCSFYKCFFKLISGIKVSDKHTIQRL